MNSKITRAILFAAGEGKRLRPLTLETPKPLIAVHGVPMIMSSINALRANGIEEFYVVVGYKKEKFYEAFEGDPSVHIIENPEYLNGNNITSLYFARDYIENAILIESDHVIEDQSIYAAEFSHSGYLASNKESVIEWQLTMDGDMIKDCSIVGDGKPGIRLWGISLWNEEDGRLLAELVKQEFEAGNKDIYWDEIPLFIHKDKFNIGVRMIPETAIMEIDSYDELLEIDPSYKK